MTRWTFDPLNESVTEQVPTTPGIVISQRTATTTYDELGLVRTAKDFASLVTATEYDRAGRATRTFEDPDPPGSAAVTSVTTYDADGKTLTTKDRRQAADADLGSSKTVYDGLGRIETVTAAFGSTPDVASITKNTWDGLDRPTANEVGFGDPSSQKTITAYDLGGRATQTDDGFACATVDLRLPRPRPRDDRRPRRGDLRFGREPAGRSPPRTTASVGRSAAEVTAGADTGDRPFDLTFDSVGNQLTERGQEVGRYNDVELHDQPPRPDLDRGSRRRIDGRSRISIRRAT